MRNDPVKPPRNQQVHTCRGVHQHSRASRSCSMPLTPRVHGPFGPACKWNATSGIAITRFGESQKPRSIIKPRLEQYRGAIYFGCATATMFWIMFKSI